MAEYTYVQWRPCLIESSHIYNTLTPLPAAQPDLYLARSTPPQKSHITCMAAAPSAVLRSEEGWGEGG